MTHYMLAMHQPDEGVPPAEVLSEVMRRLGELADRMREAGAFVLTVGLQPASSATVVRSDAPLGVAPDEYLLSDGPFAEAKEHLGGFWVIEAPDLDAALDWAQARRSRSRACPSRSGRSRGWCSDRCRMPRRRRALVFRENHGRAIAILIRLLGDLDLAEDAVQEAFVAALQTWPLRGVPPSPAGWIVTTARRRAVDRLRREQAGRAKATEAALLFARDEPQDIPDGIAELRTCATTSCASSSRAATRRCRWRRGSRSPCGSSAA